MHLRNRARLTAVTAVTALAALALGVAAPALAETVTVPDPADVRGASLSDIRRVAVVHGTEKVAVRVGFTELQPTSEEGPSGLTIFLDTDPAKKGPEFRLTTGLQEGSDYQLVRMATWKPSGAPLTCAHHLTLDFDAAKVRFNAARNCLGTPAEVRVGVKMTDLYDGSHPIVDWLGKPRTFTPWVASS